MDTMSMGVRLFPINPPMIPLVPDMDFIKVTFPDFAAKIQNSRYLLPLFLPLSAKYSKGKKRNHPGIALFLNSFLPRFLDVSGRGICFDFNCWRR
jgi:hypothetical protein